MRLAFCDTETTGFYVDAGHEAWEVAVLVVDTERPWTANEIQLTGDAARDVQSMQPGESVERTWQLPVDVSKADPMALSMNGWYTRSLQHKHGDKAWESVGDPEPWSHERWAREFMELVHGCTLIGAVPSFDERFLTRALRQGGGVPCWHYQPIDVETLAAGWVLGQAEVLLSLGGQRYDKSDMAVSDRMLVSLAAEFMTPPWDSEALSKAIGVNPDLFERHSALGDCRWAKAIWDVIMTPPETFTQKGIGSVLAQKGGSSQ